MELEGTLQVERPPTRRWIPIVGAVVPVVGFVIVAAWFIRAFIAPPMVQIPAPGSLMSEAPVSSMMARGDIPETNTTVAERNRVVRSATQTDAPVQSTPPAAAQLAALSSSPANVTPASPFPAPPSAGMAAATVGAATPEPPAVAEIEPGEPIRGPIPLPRARPSVRFAQATVTGPVPLPRPRPTEAAAKPEPEPEIRDRHNPE